jgi:hypothetical protein
MPIMIQFIRNRHKLRKKKAVPIPVSHVGLQDTWRASETEIQLHRIYLQA